VSLAIHLVADDGVVCIEEPAGGAEHRVQRTARVTAQIDDPALYPALTSLVQNSEYLVDHRRVAKTADAPSVQSRPECVRGVVDNAEAMPVGHVLKAAGWDPTVLVGDGSSSRVGQGRWLVAEADESDGSLVLHRPRHGILTSVEFDHPDHFAGIDDVDALFRSYLAAIPGVAVVCADYPRAAAMPVLGKRVTYGFLEDADFRCVPDGGEASLAPTYRIDRRGLPLVPLRLSVPGRHNRQNATGALALAVELGVEPKVAADALATFPGAHRRLERLGTWRGASIYDDYGHHPTKVRATLDAARELEHRRLVLVFQPHRFTRFGALRDEFADSLRGADAVVVTEIYAAGEDNPGQVSARDLAERVPGARFAADLEGARDLLENLVEEGDLVLLMGAGDIWKLGDGLAHEG